jgi:hypothetical protein
MTNTLAFDRSVRNIDADGRLHVAVTNISKATVNPYYGKEIPGYESLGLSAETIYYLLRDPVEIEKGAPTFNNIPLLSKHVPVSADDHQPDLVVGSTGTDARFSAPYLQNSLAIAGIDSREQCELSCAYRYTPVMQPGVYEGVAYDGIMTGIIGNHVALVEVGRAGSDVVVADSNPFIKELTMNVKQDAVKAVIKLAEDAGIDQKELLRLLAVDADKDAEPDDKVAQDDDDAQRDDESDEDYKKRMDAKKPAQDDEKDGDDDKDEKDDKKAMDAAIASARKDATADAVKRMQAIRQAEKDVHPLIGDVVAQDSAEAVYRLALDHAGVDVAGVHPSAYSALVRMHLSAKQAKPAMAHDAAGASDFWAQFPTAVLPNRS